MFPQIFIPQKFWQIGKNEIRFNKFFAKISKISLYIQLIILNYRFYFLCYILYFLETYTHTREKGQGSNTKAYHKLHTKVMVTSKKRWNKSFYIQHTI